MTTPPSHDPPDTTLAEDTRRMLPIGVAVIAVEVVTLLALWWFQTAFGR